jgi:hypothetical protein
MYDPAPLSVIPYATPLVIGPGRDLRTGTRYGVAALLLTAAYVAVWMARPGPQFPSAPLWDLRELVSRFVVPIQAVFVGAGIAFTIVTGRRGDFGPWRRRYHVACILNALAFATLAAELFGVMEYRGGGRWTILSSPI